MVLQQTTERGAGMGVHKQSVSFTDAAFNFARELVESGEYPNISAAVSGEMARARAARERERMIFEAEIQRRLALPLDAWEPVRTGESITSGARSHLARLAKANGGHCLQGWVAFSHASRRGHMFTRLIRRIAHRLMLARSMHKT